MLTKLTWNGSAWSAVDLIRGLPRSEENHAPNGMALSPDGQTLYLTVGGNTNNGAPSSYFANTAEYALSASILAVDLPALNALPVKTDTTPGLNNGRKYVYDLPTLDDPNTPNNGVRENAGGMDVAGPWGGRDGLNQAVLPADAPISIYATGLRNAYDLVMTEDGRLYTVDNGSNAGLGGNPVIVNGEATNQISNGGTGSGEPLFLLAAGRLLRPPEPDPLQPEPVLDRVQQRRQPRHDASPSPRSPTSRRWCLPAVNIADGYLIDPSKFTSNQARLTEEGIRVVHPSAGSNALVVIGSSSNGLVEYTANNFDGELKGDLLVAQFNGNVAPAEPERDRHHRHLRDDPRPLRPRDAARRHRRDRTAPSGSPRSPAAASACSRRPTSIVPGNPDTDDDGILNTVDPFIRDASNGGQAFIQPNKTIVWDFDANLDGNRPGPGGYGGGLTGVMINGTTDFDAFFNEPAEFPLQNIKLDNVKFTTAAGGGTTVIENASTGSATGARQHRQISVPHRRDGRAERRQVHGAADDGQSVRRARVQLRSEPADRRLHRHRRPEQLPEARRRQCGRGRRPDPVQSRERQRGRPELFDRGARHPDRSADGPDPVRGDDRPRREHRHAEGDLRPQRRRDQHRDRRADLDRRLERQQGGRRRLGGRRQGHGPGARALRQQHRPDQREHLPGDLHRSEGDRRGSDRGRGGGNPIYRVNVGGAQLAATDGGMAWAADTAANPSSYLASISTGASIFTTSSSAAYKPVNATHPSIPPGAPAALFDTERYDASTAPNMAWAFPVQNGAYTVNLYFAELYTGIDAAGERVFDVSVEGVVPAAFDNVDAYAVAGPAGGFIRSATVNVSDGTLNLKFLRGVQNPDVSAIEIIGAPTAAANTLVVRAGGTGTAALPPQFEVLVDGVSLGIRSITTPLAGSFNPALDANYQNYSFSFAGAAPQTVSIRYFNDGLSGTVDRNLFVDYINLNGKVSESETAGFYTTLNPANQAALGGAREGLYVNGTLAFGNLAAATAAAASLTATRETAMAESKEIIATDEANILAVAAIDTPNTLLIRAGGTGTAALPPQFEVLVDGVSLGIRSITSAAGRVVQPRARRQLPELQLQLHRRGAGERLDPLLQRRHQQRHRPQPVRRLHQPERDGLRIRDRRLLHHRQPGEPGRPRRRPRGLLRQRHAGVQRPAHHRRQRRAGDRGDRRHQPRTRGSRRASRSAPATATPTRST